MAKQAEHIGFIDSNYFSIAGLFNRAEQAMTGVVDQHIDTPEALDGTFDAG